MEKPLKIVTLIISLVFGTIGIVMFFTIIFNPTYEFGATDTFSSKLASEFGDFFGGVVGTIFSVVSILLLIYTIFHQNIQSQKSSIESNFFRMIDYHNQNVNQLKIAHLDSKRKKRKDIHEGRRAFVQFKIQIHRLFEIVNSINTNNNLNLDREEIADIVYIIFYFGIDGSWVKFIEDKLSRYSNNIFLASEIQSKVNLNPTYKIGRTNQTNLSTYFRNLYNAIKLVDDSQYLTDQEKKDLVKIYRAQLSNPELYVLFFNIMSRFGKKWKQKQYITKYELIKNLPKNYCEDYDPSFYFPMTYEDDEY